MNKFKKEKVKSRVYIIALLVISIFFSGLTGLKGNFISINAQALTAEISKTAFEAPISEAPVDYVFQGFFKNPDYTKTELYLQTRVQTSARGQKFKDMLVNVNDNRDLSTIAEIYKQTTTIPSGSGPKFSETVDSIIERNTLSGCTDYGLVFAALCRAKGIPSIFVQAGRIDWIDEMVKGIDKRITGHILVEVFVQNNWYLVDSTSGKIYLNYDRNNFNLDDGYVIFAKSLEVSDMGTKNEQDNSRVMHAQFRNFDVKSYKQPFYYFLDLNEVVKSKEFKPDNGENISQAPVKNEDKTSVKLFVIGSKEECENAYLHFGALDNKKVAMGVMFVDDKIKNYTAKNILYFKGTNEPVPKALSIVSTQLEEGIHYFKTGDTKVIVIVSNYEGKRQELLKSIDINSLE